jgi:exonuclease III
MMNEMRIAALNVGSNQKKINEVLKKYENFDFILLTEAGLKDNRVYANGVEEYRTFAFAKSGKRAKDSILLLAHKDWEVATIKTEIPRSKSIRIKVTDEETIDLHLIYGPPNTTDKRKYWKKWIKYFDKQNGIPRNIIMGDLNNILDPDTDRMGERTEQDTNILRELVNETGMVDAVKEKMPKPSYTWTRTNKKTGKTSASRIDHVLVDPSLLNNVTQAKTEDFDFTLSPDHAAVTLTLTFPETKKIKNRSPKLAQTIETVDTDNLKEEKKTYQAEVRKMIEKLRGTDTDLEPAEKWNRVAQRLKEIGTKIGKTKKRIINEERLETVSSRTESLKTNLKRIARAYGSSLHVQQNDPPTKKIHKLEANRKEYTLPPPTDGNWVEWRKQLSILQRRVATEINKEETRRTNKKIRRLVSGLRESQKTDPKSFYRRLRTSSQKGSVYRVRKPDGTRVAEAQEVKEEVARQWSEVWKTKPWKEHGNEEWFHTQKFQETTEKIRDTDDSYLPLTADEVEAAINCYSKRNRAPGVDGILPELIFFAKSELVDYMTEIFQQLMTPKPDGTFHALPSDWKLTKIFLIYKDTETSLEENPLDYRPISLLCVPYKIFTTILERRLRAIQEPVTTETQGGFRANRACCNKSLILASLLEDAKANKKEVHIGFIDLAKAYDSVNPEEVIDTMKRMGYNSVTTNLLEHITRDCRGTIITPHGDTPEFTFNGGIKQGDPLSPLLFLIFLEPLLMQLNSSKLGYKMSQTDKDGKEVMIESESFADDQALAANTNPDLQKLLNIATKFYNHYQLRLNLGKNKTAYMTNSQTLEKLHYDQGNGRTTEIPKLAPEEPYRYLGVLLTAIASWKPQESALSTSIGLHLHNILNRAITPLQKVLIANRVLIPAIEFRLQVAEIDKSILSAWNKRIAKAILRTCGWEHYDGFEIAFHPQVLGGLGLLNLHDVNAQAKTQSLISMGLNGADKTTVRVLEATMRKPETNRIIRLNKLLGRLKTQIEPTRSRGGKVASLTPFLKDKTVNEIPAENDSIVSFFPNPNDLTFARFKRKNPNNNIYSGISSSLFTSVKTQYLRVVEKEPDLIKALRRGEHSLPKEEFTKLENRIPTTYVAWTDGSYDPITGKVGSAFTTKWDESGFNLAAQTPYAEKSYAAELYAIWLVLSMAKLDFNLMLLIDNQAAIQVAQDGNRDRDLRKVRKDPLSPLIDSIRKLVRKRERSGGTTEFQHVYSHVLDHETRWNKETKQKVETMKEKFGIEWRMIAMGNKKVDGLAKEALNKPRITRQIANENYEYSLRDRENDTTYQTGMRDVLKRKIAQLHEKLAKEDIKRKTDIDGDRANLPILRFDEELIAKEQIFLIKLLWGRLKTKDRMHHRATAEREKRLGEDYIPTKWEKANREAIEHRQKLYGNDDKCPWGCGATETAEHFFWCPANKEAILHPRLQHILQSIETESIYWLTHEAWTKPTHQSPPTSSPTPTPPTTTRMPTNPLQRRPREPLQQLTPKAIMAGLIPKNLGEYLVPTDPKRWKGDLSNARAVFVQKEWVEAIHERWILRCKKLFEPFKKKPTQNRTPRPRTTTGNKRRGTARKKRAVPMRRRKRKAPAPDQDEQQTKKIATIQELIRRRYGKRRYYSLDNSDTIPNTTER